MYFPEGRIVLTINENTSLEIKVNDAANLKFYSFASHKSRERHEFFHKC